MTFRAPGSMRNDMGSLPQSSPSSCTGTSAPGALALTSVEVKDFIARYKQQHPEADVQFLDMGSREVLERVRVEPVPDRLDDRQPPP